MLEQCFGRSLLQLDKQFFQLHNWLNVSKTVSNEISTQSPCSVNSLHCLEFALKKASAETLFEH